MILAIDTSTNYACLALTQGATLLAELNWRVGQRHGSEILERAQWLLREANVDLGNIDGVAVATGPGSFNGLRVALATAKSLAFALAVPLYGISTLDVIAWGGRQSAHPIWALIDAGRGEFYAACYTGAAANEQWAPVSQSINGQPDPYIITTPAELAAHTSGPLVVVGEWRDTMQVALEGALGQRACFFSPLEVRRGAALATLADMRAAHNSADDPQTLEPLYLRRPHITKSARAMAPTALDQHDLADNKQGNTRGGEGAAHAV
jgi:tRNA threonylcarbamoyladenosine biosynthesis protein TsaB